MDRIQPPVTSFVQIEREPNGVRGVTRYVSAAPDQGVRVAVIGGMYGNEFVGVVILVCFVEVV
jgi:succinylglutamate desuccinylase